MSDGEEARSQASLRKIYEEGGLDEEFTPSANKKRIKQEGVTDGDYVYTHAVNGVYFKGGLIVDVHEDGNAFEDDEWKNANLRESVAQGSLIRCRQISSTNFFTKGKLNELGLFIKDNESINVVFVNTSLSAVQIKKLEKRWNDILMEREERMR